MKIDTLHFEDKEWIIDKSECDKNSVDIIFVFGSLSTIENYNHYALLKRKYPNADVVGTSTAGNIFDDGVSEYSAVANAISFDTGSVEVNSAVMRSDSLEDDAKKLVDDLKQNGLKHTFVLSHCLNTNGSKIVQGLNKERTTTITGGFAADNHAFEKTLVFVNENCEENLTVAVGFYGESIHVSIGCKAGWDEFGATRVVTKAEGNIVYEIDNKPALELYENYLGEYIKDLPASGLLFPLSVKTKHSDKNEVIRVMMGINDDKSITFAGDVPQGSEVRLMKTNTDNLIDGSSLVAQSIKQHNNKRSLSLAVSCSGRLSVLKQLVDEEIEVVKEILNDETRIIGFYSYGEIAPFSDDLLDCKLHNQTMAITTIYED